MPQYLSQIVCNYKNTLCKNYFHHNMKFKKKKCSTKSDFHLNFLNIS